MSDICIILDMVNICWIFVGNTPSFIHYLSPEAAAPARGIPSTWPPPFGRAAGAAGGPCAEGRSRALPGLHRRHSAASQPSGASLPPRTARPRPGGSPPAERGRRNGPCHLQTEKDRGHLLNLQVDFDCGHKMCFGIWMHLSRPSRVGTLIYRVSHSSRPNFVRLFLGHMWILRNILLTR